MVPFPFQGESQLGKIKVISFERKTALYGKAARILGKGPHFASKDQLDSPWQVMREINPGHCLS